MEPRYLKYTMAVNHALLEEDGVFWFYTDARQVNTSNNLPYSSAYHANTCCVWFY